MSARPAPKTAHISGWDRAAVIALGGAGCALSYDALQQMAVAIHIRGLLTYLFPLVIDGFIAYGIRALLVLRDAPLRARLYVWTLFGTATAASIWANALHAVRLNEDAVASTGLRLGDAVVAVLSTIAPLALAGAVHLYILIARKPAEDGDRKDLGHPGQAGDLGQGDRHDGIEVSRAYRGGPRLQPGQVETGQPVTDPADRPSLSLEKRTPTPRSLTGDGARPDSRGPVTGLPVTRPATTGQPGKKSDLAGQPDTEQSATDHPGRPEKGSDQPGLADTKPPAANAPVTDLEARTPDARRSDPDTEELLKIARSAVRAEDKLTRKVVAQAIRGQQIPLSSDTLTTLMAKLRAQHGQPVTSPQD
ncbi:DUF2637 domain-containing protein [Streptomyces roseolus]|uniref:DUF2637 domain-containing protein n=1 Tax=Streptomyces roseolus TaxID=67358 RepID=UPI00365D0F88